MNSGFSSSDIDAGRYPELRQWVVGCLSGHKKPNEIIFQLCRRTGWDWGQSKKFVEQVAQLDTKEVHKRRMPLLLGIGLVFMVGGVILFVLGIRDLQAEISHLQDAPDFQKILSLIFAVRDLVNDPMKTILRLGVVIGPAMFIGGSWGAYDAVKSAMTGEGDDLVKSGTPQR